MTKEEWNALVQKTIDAPSCCKELKAAGKAYLEADASQKGEAAQRLLAELREDVCSIDDFVALTASEHGEKLFGKEQAAQMHSAAVRALGQGVKYCLCDACTNGGKILDHASDLTSASA